MVSMEIWLVSALVTLRPEVEAQGRTDQTGQSGKQLVQDVFRLLVIAMRGIQGESDDHEQSGYQTNGDGRSNGVASRFRIVLNDERLLRSG